VDDRRDIDDEDAETLRRHGVQDLILLGLFGAASVAIVLAGRPWFAMAPIAVALVFLVRGALRLSGKQVPWWLKRSIYQQALREERQAKAGARFDHAAATAAGEMSQHDAEIVMAKLRRRRSVAWLLIIVGVGGVVGGLVLNRKMLAPSLTKYLLSWSPYVIGYLAFVIGVFRLLAADVGLIKPANAVGKRNDISFGFGFKSFVAWRYLMARHHRVSRIVLGCFFVALFSAITSYVVWHTILTRPNPLELEPETINLISRITLIVMIAGVALVYFSIIIGLLRFVFSFFTTVPVVGVWIGTAALIIVLSVMSGFETDLRQKILGSNAHIQITAESGDISDWRAVKAKIDKVPGVLASTPYAMSEVVIAASGNGMPVIIKGIDPATVGSVTKLIDSIRDDKQGAMKKLEPIVSDDSELEVPQTPRTNSNNTVDPPPDDLPTRGEPIDYSQPRHDVLDTPVPSGSGSGSDADAGSAAPMPPAAHTMPADDAGAFGGDAEYLVESKPVLDPPPADILTTDDEPIDYSGRDDAELPIDVVDVPFDPAPLSRRTQSLPGILVGQELVKQTHLYVGQEVRIVSPLSDPSNPDATGTPIPFNRDYRVAGIFFTGMYEYDLKFVYVTLDSLTDFLDRGDVVDGIEVRIGNPDDASTYVTRLRALLGPHFRVQDWRELNRSLFSALEIEKIAMFLVLGIVILVASFSIIGNLIMVVVEKAREIALIKTLGAADSNVMLVFAIQGLLIGVIGTGLGVITGLGVCWVLKSFGFPLNPDVYYIDQLPVNIDAASVAMTALCGVMISMLATFYPAIVAARVRPAAGMRH
jgi:lipoprotein-releasing system permease protein